MKKSNSQKKMALSGKETALCAFAMIFFLVVASLNVPFASGFAFVCLGITLLLAIIVHIGGKIVDSIFPVDDD